MEGAMTKSRIMEIIDRMNIQKKELIDISDELRKEAILENQNNLKKGFAKWDKVTEVSELLLTQMDNMIDSLNDKINKLSD
jgi:hypothetical protein